jgi:hypothetical protein
MLPIQFLPADASWLMTTADASDVQPPVQHPARRVPLQ